MYISNVYIRNIRCFREINIPFERNGNPYLWNTILGDNSTGKTCLLRCIAIGICDQASAAGLMKELEGNFRRKKARMGEIIITLKDSNLTSDIESFDVKTTIKSEHGEEKIEKDFGKDYGNLREKIFLCGYGVQRAGEADVSFRKYSTLEAVYTLFNYYQKLQNPELILRRHDTKTREALLKKLGKVLMLDILETNNQNLEYQLKLSKKGVYAQGPWGRMLLDEMSDGYWSTFNWLVDFIGWQTYANKKWAIQSEDLKGILLLDEIELHLHPSWQRHIVHRLKEEFPGVQFITTTHSPIVAAGAADFEDSNIIVLKLRDEQVEHDKNILSLHGKRFDEILTSEAFGLFAVKSPGGVQKITRYAELKNKKRNNTEEDEFQQLSREIRSEFPPGETDAQRIVGKAVREALANILRNIKTEIPVEALELEVKNQIKELFKF